MNTFEQVNEQNIYLNEGQEGFFDQMVRECQTEIVDIIDNEAVQVQEDEFIEYEVFSEEGTFSAINCMKNILQIFDIIYVQESGFYGFREVWRKTNDNDIRWIIHRYLQDKSKLNRINETYELMKCERNVKFHKINKNKKRLVLKNGTLDLSDWQNPIFYKDKFFREDYSTIQLNCNYDENAEYKTFTKFLETTFEQDEDIINLIQEILGYCLTTSTKYEKAFLFFGEGSNGKSTLLKVITNLLTESNVSSVNMSELDKPFQRSSLLDKLVNLCSELDSHVKDTGYFKQIVSGDMIDAQFKFKNSFSFKPICKLIFAVAANL